MHVSKSLKVVGLVTRERANSARVAVPHGIYKLRELSIDCYELSGTGLPTFTLSLLELSTYLNTKALKELDQ